MTIANIVPTPFDIEIIHRDPNTGEDVRTGKYVNRSSESRARYESHNPDTQQLYCVPGVSYRFDLNQSIDDNVVKESRSKDNFIYRLSKRHIVWEFGDGTKSTEFQPIHTYTTPGEFTVTVTMFDAAGNPKRNPYSYTFNIKNFCSDNVNWYSATAAKYGIEYTPASTPAPLELRKFTSWQNPELYSTIVMYASGSDSKPSDVENFKRNKHAHLQKLWRFVTDPTNPVPVTTTKVTEQPIRVQYAADKLFVDSNTGTGMNMVVDTSESGIDNGTTQVVGFSGSTTVYYIDDTVKNYLSRDMNPVFLFASLSADSMLIDIEESPTAVLPVKVTYLPGTQIQVTTNGIKSFTIDPVQYMTGEYTINISIVNDYGLIIKSDYDQITLTDVQTSTLSQHPFAAKVQIHDNTTGDIVPVEVRPRHLPLDTPGSGDFIMKHNHPTSADSTLSVQVYAIDPPYTPMDTPVYVLTDMYSSTAHFLTPGYAGFVNARGATYTTLPDNTMTSAVSSSVTSLVTNSVDTQDSCYSMCVNPNSAEVYIGNESTDVLLKYNLKGEQLNDSQPIYIAELVCTSGILTTDNRFKYSDVTGSAIIDELIGTKEDNTPGRFEDTQALDSLCDRFNLNTNDMNALSPSSIAADGNNDIWVTLIDGVLVVKITHDQINGHTVSAIAIPESVTSNNSNFISGLTERTSSGEYKWMPSRVVPDQHNDIWVSYTNSENVKLIKYSGAAVVSPIGGSTYPMQQLAEIDFPLGTHLEDMIIDSNNNLWVSDSISIAERHVPGTDIIRTTGGGVYFIKNDSTPSIIEHITTYQQKNQSTLEIETKLFDKPSAMTLDLSDNLYVVTGSNDIVSITTGNYAASHVFTAGTSYIEHDPNDFREVMRVSRGEVCAIDAISVNSDNRLIVVNNIDQTMVSYILPSTRDPNPDDDYTVEGVVFSATDNPQWSLMQASGDWTGIRWIRTYMKTWTSQRLLHAELPIHVKPVESDELMKLNENHDATKSFVDHTLQETINTKENLLYWFFNQVLGDNTSAPTTLGKTVFEKISNFTANNTDADICNLKNLVSLAKETGCDIRSYEYKYPGSIKRLIDMLSIKRSKLIGARDKTGMQFTKNGYANNFNHGRNIGTTAVDFNSFIVKVGTPLIARELYNSTHTMINPMAIIGETDHENYSTLHQGLTSYHLNEYDEITPTGRVKGASWNWGLSHPDDESINLYYDFYEYLPDTNYTDTDMTQLEGVIDWENSLTTASEKLTLNEWDDPTGLTSTLINKGLRKGLGLFK